MSGLTQDDPFLDDLLRDFCGRPRRHHFFAWWRLWAKFLKAIAGPSLG